MKQAKATVKEAEALLRWLQKQENADRQPPPYNRTIFGYLLMLEHCADPAKDYIDFRPGTSPDEIAALKQRAEAAEARVDSLMRDNEEQRMKVREEITKRAELEAQSARLRAALEWWRELRDESKGVAGYHLNGAIAEWGEFEDPTDAALNGQAIEVWQTNSDFSDLDAAIERDGYKLPASAKVLEARVKELEAVDELTTNQAKEYLERAEAAEARVARMTEMLLAYDAERALYLRRLLWLHDCSTGTTDADGYEWGIYRVKWVNGQAVEVWQTNSDFSDLDAAMERDEYKLPPSAKALEARVKELEADANRLMQQRDEYSGRIHSMQSKIAEAGFPMRQKWGEDLDGNEDWVTIRAEVQLDGLLKAFAREREQNARLRAALEDMLDNYLTLKRISLAVAGRDGPWGGSHLAPDDDVLVIAAKAALNGEEAST